VYVVEFMRGEERVERVDEVYFDSLGPTLAQRIDDGTWRRIQVSVIGREKLARH